MPKTVKETMMGGGPESAKYSVRVNRNGKYSHKFKLHKAYSMDKARGTKGYGK